MVGRGARVGARGWGQHWYTAWYTLWALLELEHGEVLEAADMGPARVVRRWGGTRRQGQMEPRETLNRVSQPVRVYRNRM